jgi:hypothetical protein
MPHVGASILGLDPVRHLGVFVALLMRLGIGRIFLDLRNVGSGDSLMALGAEGDFVGHAVSIVLQRLQSFNETGTGEDLARRLQASDERLGGNITVQGFLQDLLVWEVFLHDRTEFHHTWTVHIIHLWVREGIEVPNTGAATEIDKRLGRRGGNPDGLHAPADLLLFAHKRGPFTVYRTEHDHLHAGVLQFRDLARDVDAATFVGFQTTLFELCDGAIQHVFAIVVILVKDAPFFQAFLLDDVVHHHGAHMPVIRPHLEDLSFVLIPPLVRPGGRENQGDFGIENGGKGGANGGRTHTQQNGKHFIALDQPFVVGNSAGWFVGVIEQYLFELPAMHSTLLIDVFEIPLRTQACHAVAPHGNGTSEASARANFDLRIGDARLSRRLRSTIMHATSTVIPRPMRRIPPLLMLAWQVVITMVCR